MSDYKEFNVIGNCYDVKEDLKAMKCKWNPDKKLWKTPRLEAGHPLLHRIESVVAAAGCSLQLCNEYLSDEARKIQGILNK